VKISGFLLLAPISSVPDRLDRYQMLSLAAQAAIDNDPKPRIKIVAQFQKIAFGKGLSDCGLPI